MKSLIAFVFSITLLAATAAMAGGAPDLVGTWQGDSNGHIQGKGFVSSEITFVVKEQQGKVFHGMKQWMSNVTGSMEQETISGTVDASGRVVIAEHVDGTLMGTVSGDAMTLQYREDGPKGKAFIYELKRQ